MSPKTSGKFISISIVEDNRFIREGWKAAINGEDDFVLIGAFGSCEEALNSDQLQGSDVVIMDIGLPGMNGIQGVLKVKEKYPRISVVMCTVHDEDDTVFAAICNGAIGYLVKNVSPDEFKAAIRVAASGGSPMNPAIARKVIEAFHRAPAVSPLQKAKNLSEKEIQVLSELAKGKPYRAVGETFNLSVDGVRYYIRNIYEKLHVNSRAEAVAKGLKDRLIR